MNLDLKLNINKPLVFIKVATTGVQPLEKKDSQNPADRIVEISIVRIETDRTVKSGTRLVNPGRPIPAEATSINGITDDMVAQMPKFSEIASKLYSFIGDADLAGFSITNFDLKFLAEEFNRAGIPFTTFGRKIIDLSSIYNKMEKRDFRAAASRFANKQISDQPISSETVNNISIDILNGMVSSYSGDDRFGEPNPNSINERFNRNKNSLDVHKNIVLNADGKPIFNYGKFKGHLISDIMLSDAGYYDWTINVWDGPADTKMLINRIVEKARSSQSQNA